MSLKNITVQYNVTTSSDFENRICEVVIDGKYAFSVSNDDGMAIDFKNSELIITENVFLVPVDDFLNAIEMAKKKLSQSSKLFT